MAGYARTNCFLCGKDSEGLPHFRFPADLVLTSAWANACHLDPAEVTKSHKLCSKHFKYEDYSDFFYNNAEVSRTRLKRDVIPTLLLPEYVLNLIRYSHYRQYSDKLNFYSSNDSENDDDSNHQLPNDQTNDNDSNHHQHVNDQIQDSDSNHHQRVNDQIQDSDSNHQYVNDQDSDHLDPESHPELNVNYMNVDNVNIDELNYCNDEDENEIDYDEYGEDIPAELCNLRDISRFIKKKNMRLQKAHLYNKRLKRKYEKLKEEYFELAEERGVKLPDLHDLELDTM